MEQEVEKVYLYNNDLSGWDMLIECNPTLVQFMSPYDVEIIESLGVVAFDHVGENFNVKGSASAYKVNVAMHENGQFIGASDGIVGEQVLYQGGVQIYRFGNFPGSQIEGYHLCSEGRLLLTNPWDVDYESANALEKVVFKGSGSIEKQIEGIIAGYNQQKQEQREQEDSQFRSSYTRSHFLPRRFTEGRL